MRKKGSLGWGKDIRSEIVRLGQDGYTARRISVLLGLNYTSVISFMWRVGLKQGRKRWTESHTEKALKLREKGWSYDKIGVALEVNKETVRNKLKEHYGR